MVARAADAWFTEQMPQFAYRPEDEPLAESLVDEAIERFRHVIPAAELQEIRDYLVVSLLGTEEGRERLHRAREYKEKPQSEEQDLLRIKAELKRRGLA